MSYKQLESWGRTRRPKALWDNSVVSTKETAVAVTVLTTTGHLADDLDSADAGKNGYVTENQEYLHVYVEGASNNSVDIYGYNYAFGKWALLMEGKFDEAGTRSGMNAAVNTGAERQYKFHVAGVDRVAFVKKTTDAPTGVYAACSTF